MSQPKQEYLFVDNDQDLNVIPVEDLTSKINRVFSQAFTALRQQDYVSVISSLQELGNAKTAMVYLAARAYHMQHDADQALIDETVELINFLKFAKVDPEQCKLHEKTAHQLLLKAPDSIKCRVMSEKEHLKTSQQTKAYKKKLDAKEKQLEKLHIAIFIFIGLLFVAPATISAVFAAPASLLLAVPIILAGAALKLVIIGAFLTTAFTIFARRQTNRQVNKNFVEAQKNILEQHPVPHVDNEALQSAINTPAAKQFFDNKPSQFEVPAPQGPGRIKTLIFAFGQYFFFPSVRPYFALLLGFEPISAKLGRLNNSISQVWQQSKAAVNEDILLDTTVHEEAPILASRAAQTKQAIAHAVQVHSVFKGARKLEYNLYPAEKAAWRSVKKLAYFPEAEKDSAPVAATLSAYSRIVCGPLSK